MRVLWLDPLPVLVVAIGIIGRLCNSLFCLHLWLVTTFYTHPEQIPEWPCLTRGIFGSCTRGKKSTLVHPEEDGVMRMLLCSCLIMTALGLSSIVALGDDHSHRKAAQTLLLVLEVDKSLPKMVTQVVEIQLQHNPQLAPQREVLQRFLTTYLHWEQVKEEMITACTHEFTEPELQQLIEFYTTPLGKKANEKLSQLAFIAGQIGLRQAQAHEAELRQMLNTAR